MNKTKFKSLDRLAANSKVLDIYQDDDGIWVELTKDWGFEECISYRVNTCKEAYEDLKRVEPYVST